VFLIFLVKSDREKTLVLLELKLKGKVEPKLSGEQPEDGRLATTTPELRGKVHNLEVMSEI
jgi:hypothetical protein